MGVWSKNRLHFGNISGKNSTLSKNFNTGILASDKGGRIYIEEGCDQSVFSKKNVWGQQTCDKLKNSEGMHPLSSIQNGRLTFAK